MIVSEVFTPTAEVGLIIALAEVVKRFGCPHKWIPLFDIGFGVLMGIFVHGIAENMGVIKGIVFGIALGLSACGLYSGVKNVTEKGDENEGD